MKLVNIGRGTAELDLKNENPGENLTKLEQIGLHTHTAGRGHDDHNIPGTISPSGYPRYHLLVTPGGPTTETISTRYKAVLEPLVRLLSRSLFCEVPTI